MRAAVVKAGMIEHLHTLYSHLSIHAEPSAEYAVAIDLLSFVCLLLHSHIVRVHEGSVLRRKLRPDISFSSMFTKHEKTSADDDHAIQSKAQ